MSQMNLIYWEWQLIPRRPLRSIFARFPEQLLKDLVSWGSPGVYSMIHFFFGDAFWVLEFCSAVWCSTANTHLNLLDRVFSGAVVFDCDIAHRRSVAVLWMLYKIRCNPIHPLYGALSVPYVAVRVTRGALVTHIFTYESPRCSTSKYRRTFIRFSVSLWIDLADPILDCVGLAGFKSSHHNVTTTAGPMLIHWPKLFYPFFSTTIFPFLCLSMF